MQTSGQQERDQQQQFGSQAIALAPIYHWRGARPWLLDLSEDEAGWMVTLCLQREGDCCLLPLAWQRGVPQTDLQPARPVPYPTINSEALDEGAAKLLLNDLRGDGWRVTGRLDWHFTGRETNAHFSEELFAFLWRQPGATDGIENGNTLFD